MEKSQGTPAPTLAAGPDGQDERTKLIEQIIQEVQQRLSEEEAFKLTYAKLENELKHLESEEQDLLA